MTERIRELAVLPRPRSHWQAMDAGMLLARAHYPKLLLLWVIFSLPITVVVVVLVQMGAPLYLAAFLYWWFKPLYELPILMYLSRALFREPTSVRQALTEARSQLFRLFRSYLTLSRLSPSRSMTAPVVFLEQQSGKSRRQRVRVLTGATTRAYTFMVAWLNVEGIGAYALIGLLLIFLPHDYTFDEFLARLFNDELLTVGSLETIMYVVGPWLLAGLVAPMYVGGGFLLYINRRMRLEGWDIEHQFHDLQRKHTRPTVSGKLSAHWVGVGLSLLLALSLASVAPTSVAQADSSDERASVEQTREATAAIFDNADFGSTETVDRLRFKENDAKRDPKEQADIDSELLGKIAKALLAFFSLAKYLIFLLVGGLVALIVWRLLRYLPESWQFGALNRRRPALELMDVAHHPLTRSLPDNIAASARAALKQGDRRKCLSYLYRGALRTVMHRHALSVPKGATERECKQWVARCNHAGQSKSFDNIVDNWSGVAYANHQLDGDELENLINLWENEFSQDAPVSAAKISSPSRPGSPSGTAP